MIHDIFMPALSSTMTEGKIVEWVKSPGEKIEKGETVVIVESDKADMDVESFNEGFLAAILVEAGDTAPVGQAIALIAETEAEIEEAKKQAASSPNGSTLTASVSSETEPQSTSTQATTTTSSRSNGRIIASPRARKLAKELNVDLKTIQGSGPYGRIVALDIEKAAGKTTTTAKPTTLSPSVPQASTPTPTAQAAPPAPISTPISAVSGETVPLNTLQKAVVQNMVASLQIPTFHVGYTITTDALDRLYQQIKSKGVTMTALLAKAVAVTLQKHPIVNASYVEGVIKYNSSINIAVAVAMNDGGLITPVLQSADQLDIYSLSRTWKDLVNRARAKQLQPEQYSTGTFTLSNLGMFGVDRFDAILPPGQGSILAVGAALPQIVVNNEGMMGIQRQMSVNITCDHRIIYGTHAAAFLQDLAKLIETEPQSLTL
ncbi:2-oxo acid dehydrogenase subunit E2 [Pleurocapsales cyanobacterium LEGE 06147]|nr:2-oxo acid dehydrogenase subunit E2 [Pleurocapsales cyanobacterium LEGE 06147]